MASIANISHSDHITFKELKIMADMDSDDLFGDNLKLLMEISRKTETCATCRLRYLSFLDSEAIAPKPSTITENSQIADLMQEKAALLARDIQLKINRWLDGAQHLLGSFAQAQLRAPALSSVTRGTGTSKDEEIAVEVNENGYFAFSLSKEKTIRFTVEKVTDSGEPICLAIFGISNPEFAEIYPLESISRKAKNLNTDNITLQPGDYTLCVPTNEI
jgi:hypothetical protein